MSSQRAPCRIPKPGDTPGTGSLGLALHRQGSCIGPGPALLKCKPREAMRGGVTY